MAKRGVAEVMPHQKIFRKWSDFLEKHFNRNQSPDLIMPKNLLDKEQDTTSEKTRKLINWLMTKPKSLYTKFKEFLEESGQSSITEKLEGEERKQNEEIFTGTSYQRKLKNCYSFMVKNLVFGDLEDFMIKKDFIDIVKIRDIKEQVTTSEKTKMLIDCLLKMGHTAYEKFKECLKESGQLLIIQILEAEERQQNDEKFILSITSHQRILQICLPWLVENLDFDRLMDFIMKKDFIDKVKIRDIKEQVTTSDKIRKLIDWLMTKPKSFYKKFKECVKESGQSSITEKLEGEERKQNEEIFTAILMHGIYITFFLYEFRRILIARNTKRRRMKAKFRKRYLDRSNNGQKICTMD